jgi:hypothetical protein
LVGIEPGSELVPAGQRGSIENPRRWCKCIQNGGTTINIFRDFVAPIPVVDNHRIFLWDNLAAHHTAYVHQTVTGRGGNQQFSIVPRPPYMPKYGPIEYKICDITHKVMKRESLQIGMCLPWSVKYFERFKELGPLTQPSGTVVIRIRRLLIRLLQLQFGCELNNAYQISV